MKIEKDKRYIIIDGNGGFREAKVVDKTAARIYFVSRGIRPGAARGRGTFSKLPLCVTIPAFKKLMTEDQPAAL